MKRDRSILLTCEHGGNLVPGEYRRLFRRRGKLLASHRGLDIGARVAAGFLARHLPAPLVAASVTRLLVDLNRSEGHPALFSALTRELPRAEREAILAAYYRPYRDIVAQWIAGRLAAGKCVLHVSVHSFTPVLAGRPRAADVAFLYDPARSRERELCIAWQSGLEKSRRGWRVRRNYPYKGTSDGLVVTLRRQFGAGCYAGIELELNQACLADASRRRALLRDLVSALPGR